MASIITSNLEYLDRDFSIETHPYIISNESEREKAIQVLSETASKKGAFHIGFSCWENFNFMIARNSCGALIADISNTAHKIHLSTQESILTAKDRTDFIEKFPHEVTAEGWLSEDRSFERIQTLYREGKIHHIRMDCTDRKTFEKVADWMKKNDLHCDTFYLSNIPDWFLNLEDPKESRAKLGQLKAAINRVIRPGTYVIHSSERFSESTGMPQLVTCATGIYDPVAVIKRG